MKRLYSAFECVCVFLWGWLFFSKSDIIFLYCFRTFFVACKKKSIKERGWFALFGYEWNETNLELPVHSESGLNACYFLGKFFVTGESKKRDSFTSFNIVNELSGFQKNMSFFQIPHTRGHDWLTSCCWTYTFLSAKAAKKEGQSMKMEISCCMHPHQTLLR